MYTIVLYRFTKSYIFFSENTAYRVRGRKYIKNVYQCTNNILIKMLIACEIC